MRSDTAQTPEVRGEVAACTSTPPPAGASVAPLVSPPVSGVGPGDGAVGHGQSLVRRVLAAGEGLAMASGLAMALLLLADARAEALGGDVVVPGVTLAGQDVGGLDAEALRRTAQTLGHAALDRPLTLAAGEAEVRTSARALGADPVAEASVTSALAVGRSGDPWLDLRDRVAAARGDVDLPIGYR